MAQVPVAGYCRVQGFKLYDLPSSNHNKQSEWYYFWRLSTGHHMDLELWYCTYHFSEVQAKFACEDSIHFGFPFYSVWWFCPMLGPDELPHYIPNLSQWQVSDLMWIAAAQAILLFDITDNFLSILICRELWFYFFVLCMIGLLLFPNVCTELEIHILTNLKQNFTLSMNIDLF